MDNGNQVLSQHAETEGFNVESGKTWIYPTNLPIRNYQYNIVNEALLKNTMVCLPTGLGKTFIAAVVMYNYFRWYPHGKIIFMAPTKPLVKQQVEACYNIMAIPIDVTAELTGSTAQSSRDEIWEEKRVFFITPQVLQNDLERITRLAKQVKCLVFDEAHKGRGNYAYCEVIKKISLISEHFRVLALTATPGSNITEVVKVCNDLLISHIEIRTEDSVDVAPFVFKKNIVTIVVQLDSKLCQVRDDYIQVLDKYVRVLVQNRVMQGNCSTLTKGRLFYIKKEYEERSRHTRGPQHNEIMKNLNICLILYHAYEVLTKHGLRGFLTFFKDHQDNPLLRSNNQIRMIVDDVSNYLGPIPDVDMLPDGTIPEVPKETKFGHPKFYKLAEILTNHFNTKKDAKNSQVIVFCEYRESVMEAYTLLLMYKPLIKPQIFLGQGMMTQKQQINVIQSFRSGDCNTLVSTSIGEEGLDIGDVNLVVCFDTSNKSSIRMIQRIGRTGRKQEGNVIMLVTEGKEQQLLQESLAHKDYMIEAMKTSKELHRSLYPNSAKMIPDGITPVCKKIFITVDKPKQKLKNKNLMSMFDNMNQNSMYDDVDIINFVDRIPGCVNYFSKTKNEVLDGLANKCMYSVEKNRILQSTYGQIGSSANSKMLVSLLEFANSKRYNIPLSQSNIINKQVSKNDNFKQRDIRTMFQNQPTLSQADFKISQEHNFDEKCQNNTIKELQSELNEYLSMISLISFNCNICDNLFVCTSYKQEVQLLDHWIPPEITILDSLTKDGLQDFVNGLKPKDEIGFNEMDDDILAEFDIDELNLRGVVGSEIDLDAELADVCNHLDDIPSTPTKNSVSFDLPKSAKKLLLEYKTSDEVESFEGDNQLENNDSSTLLERMKKLHKNTLDFFALDDLNELYTCKLKESGIHKDMTVKIIENSKHVNSGRNIAESQSLNMQNMSFVEDHNTETSPTILQSRILQSPDLFDDDSYSHLSDNRSQPEKQEKKTLTNSISINDIYDTSILDLLKAREVETNKQKLVGAKNQPKLDSINKTVRSKLKLGITNQIKQNKSATIIDDIYDDSFLGLLKVDSNVLNTNIGTSNKHDTENEKQRISKYETEKMKPILNPGGWGMSKDVDSSDKQFQGETNQKLMVGMQEKSKESGCSNAGFMKPNDMKTRPALKQRTKDGSFNIEDIFDSSILQNVIDPSKPQNLVSKLNKSTTNVPVNKSKSKTASNTIKKLNFDQFSNEAPNKKVDEDPNITSPGQSSYENNIHKSRLKLLKIRENNSPKMKIQRKDKSMLNYEDIFGDDLLPVIVNPSQSSQSINKHTESRKTYEHKSNCVPSEPEMVEKLGSNKKNNISEKSIHKENDVIKNSSLMSESLKQNDELLSPRDKLNSLTPKSVEKRINISQESDTTLIISPETLSMFSEMRSPKTHISIDNDDFESPSYSPYSYKNKKTQSQTCKTNSVKSLPNSEELFDSEDEMLVNFEVKGAKSKETLTKCNDLFSINVESKLETPSSGSSKENHHCTNKTKNVISVSPAKTEQKLKKNKMLTHEDIFDTSMLTNFSDTNKKSNFGSTNKNTTIIKEKACEGKITISGKKYKNTSLSTLKRIHDTKQKNRGKSLDEENMEIQKYMDTLEWCKSNQSQNLKASPIKSKFQSTQISSTFNNSHIDSLLQKYSSPDSKVLSKSNLKTPGKSPILNRTIERNKQKPSTSHNSPNSTRSRKRSLTESPILSGKKRRKIQDDVDDDFEESRFVGGRAMKKKKPLFDDTINILSDDDFETSFVRPKVQPIVKVKKKTSRENEFIETEAARSSDGSFSSDERSGSSQDVFEESFVNDDTLDTRNTTTMHAHYLQTARSPAVRKGGYKIPQLPAKINQDIFSQTVDNEENTYLEDSFCVGSDDNEASQEELSELEIAERILNEQKRIRKASTNSSAKRKRNRIVVLSSDSD